MIESIGFSYIGTLFILMLTIPNLMWTKKQPQYYESKNENKLLLVFERVGQVCVTTLAILTKKFNPDKIDIWILWLVIAFIIMIIYECWWIRYFNSKRTLVDFYSSFLNPQDLVFDIGANYGGRTTIFLAIETEYFSSPYL